MRAKITLWLDVDTDWQGQEILEGITSKLNSDAAHSSSAGRNLSTALEYEQEEDKYSQPCGGDLDKCEQPFVGNCDGCPHVPEYQWVDCPTCGRRHQVPASYDGEDREVALCDNCYWVEPLGDPLEDEDLEDYEEEA